VVMRFSCLALVAVTVGSAGCAKLMGYSDGGQKSAPIPSYPDGPDGLRKFATDLLDAARRDDRDRGPDPPATTMMSDEDLTALVGAQASELAPRYHKLMETLVNRGAIELVAQVYERKLDSVEVMAIDAKSKDATAEDRALAAALQQPVPVYS